ncbi:TPA: DUF4222 domain-containing protein [Escherichia coli]|nr:DUF4222 domain-containing protein [Escherichia coli]HEL8041132.1 DUF4222 domain-containing protein [Escherichia coli]HEL8046686.1 DUF4222 domain-containing protein [Escherichia coli]HEL8050972.1 DUF4222 domain-containing protein [Escherichia coli]HEL8058814.1 DUF4222 domain-containing protein [Escherichia coli]
MKIKNTGLTASGKAHPEFVHGDIYRDKYGGTVMIYGVAERCITYRREGYEYYCVMPVYQFRRDFTLIKAARRYQPTSKEKARENIAAIKKMIHGSRGKK